MPVWTFLEFVEASGTAPFTDWVDGLPQEAQAYIAQRLLSMEGMLRWPEKWASRYKSYDLVELRIPCNRVQYRTLGVYLKNRRGAFVLLSGAIEKGNKIPKATLETADRRRKELLKEPSRVRPYIY